MAYVFISHTSADNAIAAKIATDIQALAHQVFLDEWSIQVGDGIAEQVNVGLGEADYVVVVLSPQAVESKWVEREWQSRYGDEMRSGRTIILPALIETCDVPPLLRDKKYADFARNYAVGLVELMSAVAPVIRPGHGSTAPITPTNSISLEVSELLGALHQPEISLSKCLTDTLAFAQRNENTALATFCRQELYGWKGGPPVATGDVPPYRQVEAFLSATAEVNLSYWGFSGNPNALFDHLRREPEVFQSYKMMIPYPVAELETKHQGDVSKAVMTIRTTVSDVTQSGSDNRPVMIYLPGDTHLKVLAGIRTELTRQLLDLLPSVPSQSSTEPHEPATNPSESLQH